MNIGVWINAFMGMGLDARVCADSPDSCKMLVTVWKKQIEGTLASATSRC